MLKRYTMLELHSFLNGGSTSRVCIYRHTPVSGDDDLSIDEVLIVMLFRTWDCFIYTGQERSSSVCNSFIA